MAELEIIGVPFSNYVRALRMMCEEKGVPYKLNPAKPHSPEVTAIHPAGQVPCMKHGDVALFESAAIATYIDKAFGGAKMIPEDALGAAQHAQWVSYGNVKVDRWLMREFVVPNAFFDKAKGPDMVKINAALPEMEKVCKALDDGLAETGHLVGDKLTFADLNVVPMLATAMNFPAGKEIVSKYKNVTKFVTAMTERPSYKTTAPPPRA